MLHIDPLTFMDYPPAMQYKLRTLLALLCVNNGRNTRTEERVDTSCIPCNPITPDPRKNR